MYKVEAMVAVYNFVLCKPADPKKKRTRSILQYNILCFMYTPSFVIRNGAKFH